MLRFHLLFLAYLRKSFLTSLGLRPADLNRTRCTRHRMPSPSLPLVLDSILSFQNALDSILCEECRNMDRNMILCQTEIVKTRDARSYGKVCRRVSRGILPDPREKGW